MSLYAFSVPLLSRHAGLRRLLQLLALLCLSFVGKSASANTLNVPTNYATIQDAITASANGDTVLIADGTYTGPGDVDLDLGGKNITVTSANGPGSAIINCQGSANANHRGFSLHSGETNAVISGLTIENGYESGGLGGGIENADVGVTVQNCILLHNTAGYGGGINNSSYRSANGIKIANCLFIGNTASEQGGGITNSNANNHSAITVAACTFIGNTANYGGGMDNESALNGAVTATNCTLIGNSAANYGGGIYATDNSNGPPYPSGPIKLTNCTLTGNSAPGGAGGGIFLYDDNSSLFTLTNDILYGDTGGEFTNPSGDTTHVTATHCDIQGGYTGTGNINANPQFTNPATGDVHLKPGSPCVRAGTASGAPTTDKDGTTRPNPPSIGAYELDSTLTVPAQYATIQDAIDAAHTGNTVLISDGTYTSHGNVDLDLRGKNITVTSVNGPVSTIINCQGSANANHRGFSLHSGETNAVISGLTIENGYESGGLGGGIYNSDVGVFVENCILKNNTAGYGAGINNYNASSRYELVAHCVFTGNTASQQGGGISDDNSSNSGLILVADCIFTGNTANYGGGMDNESGGSGAIEVINCALTHNTASSYGGAIYAADNSEGPMFPTGPITVTNCTLTGNSAPSGAGGGIFLYDDNNSVFTLTNDILYGDTGGEFSSPYGNTPYVTATHCDIQGGYTGTGNVNANPLFVNAPTDLHLQSGSPCLGKGTANGAPTTTLDGRARPNPPSIGAFETEQSLASVTASPSSVKGGSANATGTVTLTGREYGNAAVTVTSSNPSALSVPYTVNIGGGYSSKNFTATSHPVTMTQTVTITATYAGISKTTTVTVTP